jgi:hypothetical protein
MGIASFQLLGAEDRFRAESVAWARFSSATESDEFFASWLAILCTQLDHAEGGLLVLGPDANGAFAPVAFWPHASQDLRHLGAAAQRVLDGRQGVIAGPDGQSEPTRDKPAQIGYPIEVAGQLRGAVVAHLGVSANASLQRAFRLVHWSSAWLVDHLRQQHQREDNARMARMGLALDLAATILSEKGVAVSTLAIANELAVRLPSDRVSIGLERDGEIELTAISHTAVFNPKMAFARSIRAAMEEALDLDAAIALPPLDDAPPGAAAHAELVRDQRDVAICSVPMRDESRVIGVVTAERTAGRAFDRDTVDLLETAAALLAPIVALKQRDERGLGLKIRDAGAEAVGRLLGRSHLGLKFVASVCAAALLFFGLYSTTYRVGARAVLEGRIQRAAIAPFDGHIAESYVRAGDVVRAGQILARLDDRDLNLERTRLLSDLDQAQGKHRQAQATQDRGAMTILSAQIKELQAQLTLNAAKLERAALTAPFDGVVVSGDLSQLLDTPVEQGKLLFQISPLDSYRVILQVDERNIPELSVGQKGALMLSGMPGQVYPFVVRQITPVSTTQEGLNYFRVEAILDTLADRLRPGMEGVGKIEVGERRLIWIWTHSLFDWLRMWLWKEAP